jgi:acetylornithine/N-succinyldiaminopimelate aminotransferase
VTLCDQQQWLFMVDEVQSGIGRTGSWFAFQHAGIEPDVMTLAKGLGSGVPIGACLARGPAAGVFKPGTHGSTFGGNPLACAAALTTLEVLERDELLGNAIRQGDAIRAGFRAAFKDDPAIVDIRGVGMMIGVELDRPCGALVAMALEAGVLINVTSDTTIRLVPPLVYTDADSAELVQRLTPIIRNFLAGAQLAA